MYVHMYVCINVVFREILIGIYLVESIIVEYLNLENHTITHDYQNWQIGFISSSMV